MTTIDQERTRVQKSSVFTIAGSLCALIAFISLTLALFTEPTLTFEECLYIWINVNYGALSPTFMVLSILFIISAVLTATSIVLSFIFAYLEWKQTKKT